MLARLLTIVACLVLAGATQAGDDEAGFLIEFELWINGEAQGEPRLVVMPGQPAMVDVAGGAWRIEAEVERARAHEYAPGGSLWLHLAVHEQVEGEWEELADTMLGVPEGETATLTVVEGDVDDPAPDNSIVYLRATTSRLQPGDMPPG